MPLVNISLLKGKSREHIRAISAGVHEALMEAYKIPPKDRFQLIRQFEREDFIYDLTTSTFNAATMLCSFTSSPATGATPRPNRRCIKPSPTG